MKKRKLFAAILAVVTLTAGMNSMAVGAEENTDMAALSKAATSVGMAEEVDALIEEEQLSAADVSVLAAALAEANDSEPFSYVSCDVMPDNMIYKYTGEMAQYGVAFIANKQTGSCRLRFYLNKNMDNSNSLVATNYIAPNSNVAITQRTAVTANDTTNAKCYQVYMSITDSLPAYSTAFYYKLPKDLETINSVLDLHKNTSADPNNPIVTYNSNDGNYSFRKIVFAKGDVNRDGVIDNTDSLLILKYVTKLAEVDPKSTTKNYDEQAFWVAADYDEDNDVDIMDVIAVNRLLAGTGN